MGCHVQRAGTGERAASVSTARPRPPWLRAAGWIPRAALELVNPSTSSFLASVRSCPAQGGSLSSRFSTAERVSERVTKRCCAPSCRSRSSRCLSVSPASKIRAREALKLRQVGPSSRLEARILEGHRGGAPQRPRRAPARLRAGRRTRGRPRARHAARRSATPRSAPPTGTSTGAPSAFTYLPSSGSQ